jgi:hypothetical protein
MPPKRPSKRAVAAVSSEGVRSGSDPGSFQLPPYREARPADWFDYVESLMDMRNITDPHFRATLVQQALTYAQQDAIADVLKKRREPEGYQLIKAELLRLHERSDWDRLKELFTIKSLGGHNGTELLAAMKQLAPQDNSLWLRYLFYSCLPDSLQVMLAEENGTVEQLAARVDEHLRKRPGTAAAAPIAAAAQEEVVAAAAQARSPWKKQKGNRPKRKRPQDAPNPNGGGGAAKKPRGEPWVQAGMCRTHWRYGDEAWSCSSEPCSRKSGN